MKERFEKGSYKDPVSVQNESANITVLGIKTMNWEDSLLHNDTELGELNLQKDYFL